MGSPTCDIELQWDEEGWGVGKLGVGALVGQEIGFITRRLVI